MANESGAGESGAGESRPGRYQRSSTSLEFDRVTFFSDAVFAIAMTLLVVGIGIPHVTDAHLDQALRDKRPEIISFFISFVVIGSYWLSHHQFVARLRAVDVRFMQLNLLYLAAIAFVPFPTALVGVYETHLVSVVIYAITLGAASCLETLLFWHAHNAKLLDVELALASVVVGGVERDDHRFGDRELGPGRRFVVRGRPACRFLGFTGEADPIGAEIRVPEVEADPPGEAVRRRPVLGGIATRDRRRHRGHHPPVDTEPGVELADVVEQRGGEPAGIVGVLGAGKAGLHVARDTDGVPLVVVGLTAELDEPVRGQHRLDPDDVVGSRRAGIQRAGEATGEVTDLHPNTNRKRASSNGRRNLEITPVENTRTKSTRKP